MNKKIVVLVVLLECVLAVLLVSFFGKAIEDLRNAVLCSEIYFVDASGNKIEDGVFVEVELSDVNMSYRLHYKIESDDTTNKEVKFSSSKPDSVVVDATGMVTFFEETDVVITIRAQDGSGKSDSITLVPKRSSEGDAVIS